MQVQKDILKVIHMKLMMQYNIIALYYEQI